MELQSGFDLLYHLSVLLVGELHQAGIHGEGGAPFKLILILGDQMEMEAAAALRFVKGKITS